jgi:hypothetical protein
MILLIVNWLWVEYTRNVHRRVGEIRLARENTSKQKVNTSAAIIEQSMVSVNNCYVGTWAHPPGGVVTSIRLVPESVQLLSTLREVEYSLEIDVNVDGDYITLRLCKTAKLPEAAGNLWEVYHSLIQEDNVYAHQITKLLGNINNHQVEILNQLGGCLTEISYESMVDRSVIEHPKMVKILTVT